MPPPHQHLPGQTFRSIRRTVDGIHYLAPNRDCVRALAYTYSLGVEASDVIPHVEMTMSNHRQGLLTCLTGRRSKFHERHHGVFARQYNRRLGRSGYMWDHRLTAQPILLDGTRRQSDRFDFDGDVSPDEQARWLSRWDAMDLSDFERSILYDLCNPLAANLTQTYRTFPGFTVDFSDWGKWLVEERPHFFSTGLPSRAAFMPLPTVEFWDNVNFQKTHDNRRVVPPDVIEAFNERREWAKKRGFRGLDPQAYELFLSTESLHAARNHYNALLTHFENEFTAERQRAGKRVFGRRALIRQDPFYRPEDRIPRRERRPRRNNRPRFIGSSEARARAERAYIAFLRDYLEALNAFRNDRDFGVVFPAGTVKMVQIANVRCRGAPLPANNPML